MKKKGKTGKAKEEQEATSELYYNQKIIFKEGCGVKKVIIYQSGNPPPPPCPPGGCQ